MASDNGTEEVSTELSIIDKSMDLIKGGGVTLLKHQKRSALAERKFNSVLKDWEAADEIEDPVKQKEAFAAADFRSNEILSNASRANNEMKEERKAFTALMDMIREKFTTEENKIDVTKGGKPLKIQQRRDAYAKWLVDEKKRLDKIAQDKADKAKEETELRASWNKYIADRLLIIQTERLMKMTNSFNAITLEDYAKKEAALKNAVTDFSKDEYKSLVLPAMRHIWHIQAEIEIIRNDVKKNYPYDIFEAEYTRQVQMKKTELIDRLPSKKQELEDAERLRIDAEKAEKLRQEELTKAKNKKEKELLEQQQQEQRQREEAAIKKQDDERKQREEDDRKKLELDAEKQRKANVEKIDLEATGQHAQTEFTHIAETSANTVTPIMREGFAITVLHAAGWIELITLWYQKSGAKEPLEELEKKTFKQIKTFCEKLAMKGEMISFDNGRAKTLKYEGVAKAINKAETKKKSK